MASVSELADALRRAGVAEVDITTRRRAEYSSDASNYRVVPAAVAFPRDADEVAAALAVCRALGVPITPRGAGTSIAGNAAGDGTRINGVPSGVRDLVRSRLALIRTEFGRFTRQVSGYSLEHLLPEHGADIARFLVGTEGTLGVITRATVRLVAAPRFTALAVLGYPDLAAAADAAPALLPHRPVALEGLDARIADVVRARRGGVPDLPRGGAWLFAETAGDTAAEASAAAHALLAGADCLDSVVLTGAAARTAWRMREDGAGLAGRTPAGSPAWPGWEDAAVPPEKLGAYLREFAALLRQHGVEGLAYGHFGDGCVHARIDFPLASRPRALREFVVDAARLVGGYGG